MMLIRKEKTPRYMRDGIISYLLVSEQTCNSEKITVTLVEMEPGGLQRLHAHVPEQMYYILEGTGIVTVGDERETVNRGDCIFFPSMTKHGLKNTGKSILRYLSAASPSFGEDSLRLWPLQSEEEEHRKRSEKISL
jgi:mannose-6-phosphate isomerase-like protein (cupin superfamily)